MSNRYYTNYSNKIKRPKLNFEYNNNSSTAKNDYNPSKNQGKGHNSNNDNYKSSNEQKCK